MRQRQRCRRTSQRFCRAHTVQKHRKQFTTITSSKSNSSSPTASPLSLSPPQPLPVCLLILRTLSLWLVLFLSRLLSEKLMLCLRALSLIYTCSRVCVWVWVCIGVVLIKATNALFFQIQHKMKLKRECSKKNLVGCAMCALLRNHF